MAQATHPQILFASDLRRGETLLLGESGWVRDPRRALVARDAASGADLLRRGEADLAKNRVVDVYLADVEVGEDGVPSPLHYREKRRLAGPSVRPDLFADPEEPSR
ncbi:MAG TPA: DUF2849 domain-containing protein [Methylocystis sp.]|nr:DUF2849 domain-containing protein [Methylocystis sp.]